MWETRQPPAHYLAFTVQDIGYLSASLPGSSGIRSTKQHKGSDGTLTDTRRKGLETPLTHSEPHGFMEMTVDPAVTKLSLKPR